VRSREYWGGTDRKVRRWILPEPMETKKEIRMATYVPQKAP
jgi:hypothetical protein